MHVSDEADTRTHVSDEADTRMHVSDEADMWMHVSDHSPGLFDLIQLEVNPENNFMAP